MNRPIGIFDSGIGGLAVARAVKDLLPEETIIYFGDTAHMPYGSQSDSKIQHYVSQICNFLLQKNCKVILTACNSAASAAQSMIHQYVSDKALLLDVISPMVHHVARHFSGQVLGLIGTKQTVKVGLYPKKLYELSSGVQLKSLATPELIAMIEAGIEQKKELQDMIRHTLQSPALQNIQGLILGCTHYAFIKPQLKAFYEGQVAILDAALLTAQELRRVLTNHGLLNKCRSGQDIFFASQLTSNFEAIVRMLFDQPTHLV